MTNYLGSLVTQITWDGTSQVAIVVLGVTGIFLVAKKSKWGFVFGLASQPFWFITSYQHQQWGVFFVSIAYTASWIYGIYNWFKKPKTPADPSAL